MESYFDSDDYLWQHHFTLFLPIWSKMLMRALPSLFTALQEQLGLKLEAMRRPVEMIVIDRVERPSDT